jgi:hypothetical protein
MLWKHLASSWQLKGFQRQKDTSCKPALSICLHPGSTSAHCAAAAADGDGNSSK